MLSFIRTLEHRNSRALEYAVLVRISRLCFGRVVGVVYLVVLRLLRGCVIALFVVVVVVVVVVVG